MTRIDNDWWKQAVVYQVYPRSFRDSNGDGLGDIRGVTERMDYLHALGIDAIWLSPFYPSPLIDGGYDVADYRNVDPRLGTLDDFDEMVAAAHAAHIKVIVDIVPNHTSTEHAWFKAALAAGPGSSERERYIFRQAASQRMEIDLRRRCLGGRGRRRLVLAPVCERAGRPELEASRGAGGFQAHVAVLV